MDIAGNSASGYIGLGGPGRDDHRVLAIAAQLALLCGLAVVAAFSLARLGGPGFIQPLSVWIPAAIIAAAAALCLLRAALTWEDRTAWMLIGVAFGLRAIGQFQLASGGIHDGTLFQTHLIDLCFLAFYPLAIAALLVLVRDRLLIIPGTLWLDASLAALALATLSTPVLANLVAAPGQSTLDVFISIAYPIGDAILLGTVIGILALPGFRPDRAQVLLLLGLALAAIANAATTLQAVDNTPGQGSWLDVLWPLAALLVGLAAWEPARRAMRWPMDVWRPIVMPTATAAVALAVYVLAPTETATGLGATLAVITLGALLLRMAVALVENRRMLRAAHTDEVTGLWNRTRLVADLTQGPVTLDDPVRVIAVLRLTGFVEYRDAFGTSAGESLLARLGGRLRTSIKDATAYRAGPESLCLVIDGHTDAADATLAGAADAIAERGAGYEISTTAAIVSVPYEAGDGVTALNLAEERIQSSVGGQSFSAARQAEARVLRELRDAHPSLADRSTRVPELARAVGRRLGVEPDELRLISHAAELCDLGRLELPDAILENPGPLNPAEAAAVQRHTLMAEHLISTDPTLLPIARVVRSTAERYDGSGYPDRLAGAEIPLPSRIIFACVAYDAMTSPRAHRQPLGTRQALAQLRSAAGSQFDPRVVTALCSVIEEEAARVGPSELAHAG